MENVVRINQTFTTAVRKYGKVYALLIPRQLLDQIREKLGIDITKLDLKGTPPPVEAVVTIHEIRIKPEAVKHE